ncbi:MAG: DUF6351 family protein [Porticoccaceae bacterium]
MNISRRLRAGVVVFIIAGFAAHATLAAGGADRVPRLQALSTKPHLVSGGNVLLAVEVPGDIALKDVRVSLEGKNITALFRPDEPRHRMVGLVADLRPGKNRLSVGVPSAGFAGKLTVTNHPATGPVISGPHVSPFVCQTEIFKMPDGSALGPPLDKDCSIQPRVDYVYLAKGAGKFAPLADRRSLPLDLDTVTTTSGEAVPFVVRVETRTINRGIYQSAVLHNPVEESEPSPFAPPKAWNRRLIAVHGFGCVGGWNRQGNAQGGDILDMQRLGEGYALFTNTLNHPTNNCNPVLAGETTMMGKEHFIETMGEPDFTVSIGSSGGAYTSLQIADALPGLFDGVLIGSTFPDALSIALSGLDDHLLAHYFLTDNSSNFTEQQMVAVSGYKNARAWYDMAMQSGRTDPVPERAAPIPGSAFVKGYRSAVWHEGMPGELRYHPVDNPGGARPTVFDAARNIYGVDAATGFAKWPFDNVGVQYGLEALDAGLISPQQFIDLNERIGGFDPDANIKATRSEAEQDVLNRTYRSGIALSGGGGLAQIPVFDLSHLYDEGQLYHYQWFHFAVRERMQKYNGHTDNHVMWRGGGPVAEMEQLGGTPSAEFKALKKAIEERSWETFIQWVSRYKADKTTDMPGAKVIRHKPPMARDGCFTWSSTPEFIAEPQTWSREPDSTCNRQWPSWSFVRKEAGGPLDASILKCRLKPLSRGDYRVNFTGEQWRKLEALFPEGVCDWSKPGVGQEPVVPWLIVP